MDLEDQYDKIYRYCFFKVHQREIAEDITQETFLRFFESRGYVDTGKAMHYLYAIARNLCIDEYRRQKTEDLDEEVIDRSAEETSAEENMLTRIVVRRALAKLEESDRELLLLRYVNDVPVLVLSRLYGISRFAVYRRVSQAVKRLKEELGKEDLV